MSQWGKQRTFRNAEWVVTYQPLTDGLAFRGITPRDRIVKVLLLNVARADRLADARPTRRDFNSTCSCAADVPPLLRDQANRYVGKPYSSWLADAA